MKSVVQEAMGQWARAYRDLYVLSYDHFNCSCYEYESCNRTTFK